MINIDFMEHEYFASTEPSAGKACHFLYKFPEESLPNNGILDTYCSM